MPFDLIIIKKQYAGLSFVWLKIIGFQLRCWHMHPNWLALSCRRWTGFCIPQLKSCFLCSPSKRETIYSFQFFCSVISNLERNLTCTLLAKLDWQRNTLVLSNVAIVSAWSLFVFIHILAFSALKEFVGNYYLNELGIMSYKFHSLSLWDISCGLGLSAIISSPLFHHMLTWLFDSEAFQRENICGPYLLLLMGLKTSKLPTWLLFVTQNQHHWAPLKALMEVRNWYCNFQGANSNLII